MSASHGTPRDSNPKDRLQVSVPSGSEQGEDGAQGEREETSAERPDSGTREQDIAETPGSDAVPHEHADALADEWGEESFPVSDPPAHY
ncbi:hypothetical protein [Leucobacter triazinivorans]|uniref:Uncharacterized protein n=1 Tax=Leucobacter triazinivorans TaxID=1784719 RepID=A0A4P6KD09_9MICO|nr:hypothetical protein [Leucobacter triazinivorans]QBE48167.1 hypothetical protein EVS81_04415 [Leucobacter triazinivorans]